MLTLKYCSIRCVGGGREKGKKNKEPTNIFKTSKGRNIQVFGDVYMGRRGIY